MPADGKAHASPRFQHWLKPDSDELDWMIMIRQDIFLERVKCALVRAGIPIATTYDSHLSSGAFLEFFDDEMLPPKLFLKWRVNPILTLHFRSVKHDELLNDPQVQEMNTAESAMNEAITKILTASGFAVHQIHGERVGELFITDEP